MYNEEHYPCKVNLTISEKFSENDAKEGDKMNMMMATEMKMTTTVLKMMEHLLGILVRRNSFPYNISE